MRDVKIEPASPFPNGLSYEFFLEYFCCRCKKHKVDEEGFIAFVEEGGCPIENAMEEARFGHPFPSQDIVMVSEDGEIRYFQVCTKFVSDDETLMKNYKAIFGDTEVEQ